MAKKQNRLFGFFNMNAAENTAQYITANHNIYIRSINFTAIGESAIKENDDQASTVKIHRSIWIR
ncbi:hypothetical protein MPLDJ20_60007 [Mesorhizobium plurifarium]|uniref:Uncharacterized protein n=1 Tax=Mesorhizobium plurifarium TaxID=69974 RepID=A0A090FMF1_MESPL|nr:hypothetical protein MPLDJ20_60007 [Mesorhizobium plurifarium]